MGVSRGCPKFESTRCYLRNGKSYELLILYAFLYNPSQQKPINNFGNSSHGRSQGLSKLPRPCTCMAHRTVTFAIAWLSCLFLLRSLRELHNKFLCVLVTNLSLELVKIDNSAGQVVCMLVLWSPCSVVCTSQILW